MVLIHECCAAGDDVLYFLLLFLCWSTEASISIKNASVTIKHLVPGNMSPNTATTNVYNKCGMLFVIGKNKSGAHWRNGQILNYVKLCLRKWQAVECR